MDQQAQQNNQQQPPQQQGVPMQGVPQQPYPQQQMPQPGQQPMQGMPPQGAPQQPPQIAMQGNPNSTQNTLLIAEIRDGIVIMTDGSYRAVVMCKSINFDLMSPEERESVEYAYQGFLNSLYYPVQVFIRSKKVDMRPYLEKLTKLRSEQDNMLLGLLMDDYVQFIDILAQETNIMDKQFYMVVPYFPDEEAKKALDKSTKFLTGFLKPKTQQNVVVINEADLEKAKNELKNRVQNTVSGLMQLGVQSVPLDTEALIELYYDSYNPDTATRQRIKNWDELTAPVIQKGDGNAPQPGLDTGV